MKRTIAAVIIAACVVSSTAEAQLIRSAGLMLGTSAASQDWSYATIAYKLDAKTRWGVDLGAFVEWLNMAVFSVSTGMHYVQKGFKLETPTTTAQSPDGNGSVLTQSPRVDYLSIPILAKSQLDLAGSSLYAFAGPRFDFRIGRSDDVFADVLDQFRSAEIGATVGLGVEAVRVGTVGLGARFSLLSDIPGQLLDESAEGEKSVYGNADRRQLLMGRLPAPGS